MNNEKRVVISYTLRGCIEVPVTISEDESIYDRVSRFVDEEVSDIALISGLERAPFHYSGFSLDAISIDYILDANGNLLWVKK